ncbi:MAG TPA: proteasome ATPase, partial [Actinobacteria bacterium]|nr:proteasome ATPase [Actinomycetota bacterium]
MSESAGWASRVHDLETALTEVRGELAAQRDHNGRLIQTLRDAREQIVTLKEQVDKLGDPPHTFGTVISLEEAGTATITASGRKMRVAVSPSVDRSLLLPGREVVLNESLTVIDALAFEEVGEIVVFKELLEGGDRGLVVGHTDEERVVRIAEPLRGIRLRAGDSLLCDVRTGVVYERIPKSEVEELVLEEVPDIRYEDIGGLRDQIEAIRDAVELPFLHPDLYAEHQLKPPKGILLYGPPGCGKTLIA